MRVRPVLATLVASAAVLASAGCAQLSPASAQGEAAAAPSLTASAMPEPSPSSDASTVGEVRAPVVVGEVEVRSAAPSEVTGRQQVIAPVRIEIDDLDLDMPIDPVGVEPDGTMQIPDDSATAGWYRFGPAPGGEAGNAVLAAHVDDSEGVGPFARLRDIDEGASITVTTADGSPLAYRVSRVEQTDKQEVDIAAVFDEDGPATLVMVTCGGSWNAGIGHYTDNVIVSAVPVDVP